jgi:hypothetical protein
MSAPAVNRGPDELLGGPAAEVVAGVTTLTLLREVAFGRLQAVPVTERTRTRLLFSRGALVRWRAQREARRAAGPARRSVAG